MCGKCQLLAGSNFSSYRIFVPFSKGLMIAVADAGGNRMPGAYNDYFESRLIYTTVGLTPKLSPRPLMRLNRPNTSNGSIAGFTTPGSLRNIP